MKNLFNSILIVIILSINILPQLNLEWVKRYNKHLPGGNWTLADYTHTITDAEGNLYVTGPSDRSGNSSHSDILTIKFNPQGDSVWGNKYNDIFNYEDTPNAIAIDGNNNVIVAGLSSFSSVYCDAIVIKYSSAGDTLWTRTYRGSSIGIYQYNRFLDLVVDDNNNIYVTGRCDDSTGQSKVLTIKYNSSGEQIWVSKFDDGESPYVQESGFSICIDPSQQYCYVAGQSIHGISAIKYNCADGSPAWTRIYNGTVWRYLNILTDNNGDILLATSDRNDFLVIKYSPAGDTLWFRSYSEVLNSGSDYIRDMKIDSDNNIYVTGESNMFSSHDLFRFSNWSTIKYNSAGDQLWTRTYSRSSDLGEAPCGLVIDKNGDILVGGFAAEHTILVYDYIIVKYDRETGETKDTYFYYNLGDHSLYNDYSNSIVSDTFGNIFITGTLNDISNTSYDFGTIKLSSPANSSVINYKKSDLNKPISDLQNTVDTIIVGGSYNKISNEVSSVTLIIDSLVHTNDSDLEFYLIHETANDTLVFHAGGTGDNFVRMTLDDLSPILVDSGVAPFTGSYKPYSSFNSFKGLNPAGTWILKIYDNSTGETGVLYGWSIKLKLNDITDVRNTNSYTPQNIHLEQNYPNPFNPETKIKYSIPVRQHTTVKVFDILGKEITTLVDKEQQPGQYEVNFPSTSLYNNLSSGIYFYQLKTGAFVQTRKMILLK